MIPDAMVIDSRPSGGSSDRGDPRPDGNGPQAMPSTNLSNDAPAREKARDRDASWDYNERASFDGATTSRVTSMAGNGLRTTGGLSIDGAQLQTLEKENRTLRQENNKLRSENGALECYKEARDSVQVIEVGAKFLERTVGFFSGPAGVLIGNKLDAGLTVYESVAHNRCMARQSKSVNDPRRR